MNIWHMTKKDLQVFFRDRGALIWMFLLPLVFIVLFAGLGGGALSGSTSDTTGDNRTPLAVVNLDAGGGMAKRFIEDLDQAGGYRVVLYSQPEAEQMVNTWKLRHYLVIPQNFSGDLSQGKTVNLVLMTHPNASAESNRAALEVITGVANDTSLELQILDGINQMGAMQAANPQAQQVFNLERTIAQAKSQFERSRQSPLVEVVQRVPQDVQEAEAIEFDLSQTIVPGMTVLFVFIAASTVARNIYEEKKNGSLRRLLSAPIKRWELLAGKMVPIYILTVIQIIFIFAIGAVILPLLGFGRLGIGNDPLAWAAASLVIALCSTCLGILISGVARTEGQINGVSNALLWITGFLGGALVPSFLIQSIDSLNFLSRLVPQTWATQAYYDILARGKGLADILPSLGILLVFSAVFFFFGARRFRFE